MNIEHRKPIASTVTRGPAWVAEGMYCTVVNWKICLNLGPKLEGDSVTKFSLTVFISILRRCTLHRKLIVETRLQGYAANELLSHLPHAALLLHHMHPVDPRDSLSSICQESGGKRAQASQSVAKHEIGSRSCDN